MNLDPSHRPTENPFVSPAETPRSNQTATGNGYETGALIPYKNPSALAAYYLGLFSLFPVLGLLLAIPAFILGIMGLRARNRDPAIKGSVHAWIGVVMGGICTVVWGLAVVGIIAAVISSQ
ncbi:DUF4190 domain-containing protein [Planctomycetes bacterium K23_9]|uniref:DUF4190 domain-containing protein n=1 Tax=Stieleria marina TaxID=1930275 RepID=A0A517P0V1_9BACT|nr:hypothetical protein K239x_50150 [Planctomycetes bacterium K23_9]